MKLAKKIMKQINYCLNLEKQMRHLIMQNYFVQKLMELNMNLIVFLPLKFIEKIHNYEITLDEAIDNQTELISLNKLNNGYNSRNTKIAKEKNRVLEFTRKLSDARDEIINFFEKGNFLYEDNIFKTKEK